MIKSVDLTNLYEMLDGDKELEKALFSEFLMSSDNAIAVMRICCTDENGSIWRSTAHALKGTSLNLGAAKLGKLWEKAQNHSDAGSEDKLTMLEDIEMEYTQVKKYLLNLSSGAVAVSG